VKAKPEDFQSTQGLIGSSAETPALTSFIGRQLLSD
jgi:hypothetical protein